MPALPCLHSPRSETPTLPYILHMIDDRDFGISVQDKVAVHGVDVEVFGHRALGGGQALCYDGSAVDSAGSWGVPEGTRVGEEVGVDVGEVGEFEDGFHGGVRVAGGWWGDEGRCGGHFGGVFAVVGVVVVGLLQRKG